MERADCRDARILLERLKCLYHIAKAGPRGDRIVYDTYVRQALDIAERYTAKFGQTLAKAAPDLSALALYDLEPTNNHSERAMRFVVGHRNVCMQLCSLRGMWRCGVLWTCIRTWRLRGPRRSTSRTMSSGRQSQSAGWSEPVYLTQRPRAAQAAYNTVGGASGRSERAEPAYACPGRARRPGGRQTEPGASSRGLGQSRTVLAYLS